jgi:hypothetical protein
MKKLFIILIFASLPGIATNHPQKTLFLSYGHIIRPYKRISQAMGIYETSCNDSALNRKEMAFGRYQIRQPMLTEFNRSCKKNYKLQDMFNKNKSNEVFLWHASKFSPNQVERIARTWNGGASGMRKTSTKKYFEKVQSILESL